MILSFNLRVDPLYKYTCAIHRWNLFNFLTNFIWIMNVFNNIFFLAVLQTKDHSHMLELSRWFFSKNLYRLKKTIQKKKNEYFDWLQKTNNLDWENEQWNPMTITICLVAKHYFLTTAVRCTFVKWTYEIHESINKNYWINVTYIMMVTNIWKWVAILASNCFCRPR